MFKIWSLVEVFNFLMVQYIVPCWLNLHRTMFNVKPILKESVTVESCNAVHCLRGMLLYDFMIGCGELTFPYCWKGKLTPSAFPLSSSVLSLCFTWSKPILITTTETYHLLLYAGCIFCHLNVLNLLLRTQMRAGSGSRYQDIYVTKITAGMRSWERIIRLSFLTEAS